MTYANINQNKNDYSLNGLNLLTCTASDKLIIYSGHEVYIYKRHSQQKYSD